MRAVQLPNPFILTAGVGGTVYLHSAGVGREKDRGPAQMFLKDREESCLGGEHQLFLGLGCSAS